MLVTVFQGIALCVTYLPGQSVTYLAGSNRAQTEIPALNATARDTTHTYFAGAWQRYGFHEDGLLSAVRLSEQLLRRDPWTA